LIQIKYIIRLSNKFKPVIKRIVPIKLLRAIKYKLITRTVNQLIKNGKKPFEPGKNKNGISLIGLVRAEMGLGQSCRLLAGEIENCDIEYSLYDFSLPHSKLRTEDHTYDNKISEVFEYNINIIHINPDEMLFMYSQLDASIWDYRYNIAFWLWELETIPEHWKTYFPLLDEIWTPSEFISDNLRKVTDLPVKTIPYSVTVPVEEGVGRSFFHLQEGRFLFLIMYDSNSTMDRKNPIGAINAYKMAFPKENENVGLVIKVNNVRKEDLNTLKIILKDYHNVYYITDVLSKLHVNSLIQCVDVFVSLHRAEGFGLVLAEAMMLGTATIATNWSSNTEFMNDKVACMVDYTFTTLKEDSLPYKKGCKWAEPDINQASEYMKKLYFDQDFYHEICALGKEYINGKLKMQNIVDLISTRINEIYEMKG